MLNKRIFVSLLSLTLLVAMSSGCRKPKGPGADDTGLLNEDIYNNDDELIPDMNQWDDIDGPGGVGIGLGDRFDLSREITPGDGANIQNVLFGYDSSNVEPSERYKVEEVGGYLLDNPDVALMIEGHADERGSSDYNLALSERRALAIRDYVLSLGVQPERMTTAPMGEEAPVAFGHDESTWQMNRRGEFRFFK